MVTKISAALLVCHESFSWVLPVFEICKARLLETTTALSLTIFPLQGAGSASRARIAQLFPEIDFAFPLGTIGRIANSLLLLRIQMCFINKVVIPGLSNRTWKVTWLLFYCYAKVLYENSKIRWMLTQWILTDLLAYQFSPVIDE